MHHNEHLPSIPAGYDAWKLSSPPELGPCVRCMCDAMEHNIFGVCMNDDGCTEYTDDPGEVYDPDRTYDERRDREAEDYYNGR